MAAPRNNAAIPVSLFKSYSAFAGSNGQRAMVVRPYRRAMVLTLPPLAIFYYYLPKSTGVPIYSHRMGVIAFWSLIFMYLWTGAHHLLWTPIPDWVQTLAMAFSIMLIAPSWAAVFNGYFSMNGQWHQMRENYLVKFLIFGSFYGLRALQVPPRPSAPSPPSSTSPTGTRPVHMGTLGWVSLVAAAVLYRSQAVQPRIYSVALVNLHFWLAVIGQLIFSVTMWIAGVQQAP